MSYPCPQKLIPAEKNCHIITIKELSNVLPPTQQKIIPCEKIITIIEFLNSLPSAPKKTNTL